MRTLGISLMVLMLCSAMAMAATSTDVVTVTVNGIDSLTVPAATGLTLSTEDATPGAYTQATATDADGVHFNHNWDATFAISAAASKKLANVNNDITLNCTLEGASAQTLVLAGTDQSSKTLLGGIAAGHHLLDLTWTADATLANTNATAAGAAQTYVWDVLFTSAVE